MLHIDNLLDRIGGAQVLTTLDLTKGYWQIPPNLAGKPKTAFAAPSGLYQFTIMPFGLNGAAASFQRVMDKALRGVQDHAVAYIDEPIIAHPGMPC